MNNNFEFTNIIHPLTPEFLKSKGFKYKSCGISGADMWQGMPFWTHTNGLILRGSVSSSGRGALLLYPYFNTKIETQEDLEKLLNLFI